MKNQRKQNIHRLNFSFTNSKIIILHWILFCIVASFMHLVTKCILSTKKNRNLYYSRLVITNIVMYRWLFPENMPLSTNFTNQQRQQCTKICWIQFLISTQKKKMYQGHRKMKVTGDNSTKTSTQKPYFQNKSFAHLLINVCLL